jgi:3-methyladenine DNA glycosylase Mpg
VGKDLPCLHLEFLGGRAGEGVRDEDERIARGPMRLCDGSGIRHETVGADRSNRDAASLQEDSVQHTAG